MKRERRWRALAVLLFGLSVCLSACGSSSTTTEEPTEEEESVSAAVQSEETTEESAEEESEDLTMPNFSAGLDDEGNVAGVDASSLVTLPDYRNLTLPRSEVEVSDEEVQSQIDSILAEYSETVEVTDRAVEDGDTAHIDYVGSIDGVEFDGGSAEGYDLVIGSQTFIDGFEEQLIGHEPGETFDIEVTFPEDYASEELAGQDAVFSITLHYIAESESPELTDAFVEENLSETYGYDTVDGMTEGLRESLESEKQYTAVWDALLDGSTFGELPDDPLEEIIQFYVDYNTMMASYYYGLSLDEYLSYCGIASEEDFREELRGNSEEMMKKYLIAQSIAEAEDLVVDEEAVQEMVGEENYDTYAQYYGVGYLKVQVRFEKLVDLIFENATLA